MIENTADSKGTGNELRDALHRRPSRFWYWFWGIAIVLIGLLLAAVVSQYRHVPLKISQETTYVTDPLRPDGKSIDYLAAFEKLAYSENIKSDENGFRILIENLGKSVSSNPLELGAICRKLGLKQSLVRLDSKFDDPYRALNEWARGSDFDETVVQNLKEKFHMRHGDGGANNAQQREPFELFEIQEIVKRQWSVPWTKDDLPMMEGWLEDNKKAFDIVAKSVRQSAFECPIGGQNEGEQLQQIPMPELQWLRSLARGLWVRANYRVGTGDIDGAIDDFESCKLLGWHLQNQCLAMHVLVGVAIEGIANGIELFGFDSTEVTRDQLDRLMRIERKLPRKIRADLFPLFERFVYLEQISILSKGMESDIVFGDEKEKELVQLGVDWNIVAKTFNQQFNSDIATKSFGIQMTYRNYFSRQVRSRLLGRSLASGYCDTGRLLKSVRQCQNTNQIRQIVLAMLLYEKDHGALPPAFSADPNGKPLHSWRVLLLPYLGQQKLYDQLNLNEPWDSPHNFRFSTTDVPQYRHLAGKKTKSGETHFSVVLGIDLAFTGSVGTKLKSGGTSIMKQIMVVERNETVCWMNPNASISLAAAKRGINSPTPVGTGKPTAGIGSEHQFGANFGFRSGAVGFLQDSTSSDDLVKMLMGKFKESLD